MNEKVNNERIRSMTRTSRSNRDDNAEMDVQSDKEGSHLN